MRINIKVRGLPWSSALCRHAERRLRFVLARCDDRIQRVVMRLSDVNGPRGGLDKRCHLQLVAAGLPEVVVKDTAANLYRAIDRATDRAARNLVRKIKRQQTLRRQGRPPVSEAP